MDELNSIPVLRFLSFAPLLTLLYFTLLYLRVVLECSKEIILALKFFNLYISDLKAFLGVDDDTPKLISTPINSLMYADALYYSFNEWPWMKGQRSDSLTLGANRKPVSQ